MRSLKFLVLYFCSLIAFALLPACNDSRGEKSVSVQPPQTRPTMQSGHEPSEPSGPAPSAEIPAEVKEVESQLPKATPLDTLGGQLLQAYLQDRIPGEQVVAETFADSDQVMSTLAEMSMAIHELKEHNQYSQKDQEKVLVLEGALTQFLNERAKSDEQLAAAVEYGTALSLGILGGVYSDKIIEAAQRFANTSVVQVPVSAVKSVYDSLKGSPEKISAWLSTKSAKAVESEPVTKVVDRSSNLYRRSVGYYNVRGVTDTEQVVFRNVARVLNSPELAKGYQVVRVPSGDLQSVSHYAYDKTGIPGFKLHQTAGEPVLTARLIGRNGAYEYFRIQGRAIRTLSKDGTEMVIPAGGMIGLLKERLQNWGRSSVQWASKTGQGLKNGVVGSAPYRYVAENPRMQKIVQGTAVGAPIGIMTLLALRPIDPHYITLDQYVGDLRSDGMNLDDFLQNQERRAEMTTGRR